MLDVLVVGGGPAGAGTAFQLARRGVRVRVLERASFPRPKPCAECLSPQTSRLLHDMGVLEECERDAAQLRGMVVRGPNGVAAKGDYVAAHGFRAFRDTGLSIRREILDAVLLRRAREAGAEVTERCRVTDVLRAPPSGPVRGVRVMDDAGRSTDIHARMVIGADGLRSVVSRRLGLARTAAWPRRVALVAHYGGVAGVGAYGEMHVERDGFVGIADVGRGMATVAAVFPSSRAREISADRSAFLDRWLASKPHLTPRFAHATRESTAAAVGPFASHARRAYHSGGGALLVGDAADFFDPFTGEGIYSALRGAELAAEAVTAVLQESTNGVAPLREYDRARRREFGGKWRVEFLIGAGVASPTVMNRAARALAGDKRLADLLVGVTGDFVPAGEVLRLGYLARLFLGVIPSAARDLQS